MNARYLEEVDVRTKILQIWKDNPAWVFLGKLRLVVKFYKGYCIQTAKAQRVEEAHLRVQLSQALEALQVDPSNSTCQSCLRTIGESLDAVERRHIEGLKIHNRIKWKKVGDACSKQFFQAYKDRGTGARILQLEDAVGFLQSEQASLERICSEYYSRMYTVNPPSPAREGAEYFCLRGVAGRVSQELVTLL